MKKLFKAVAGLALSSVVSICTAQPLVLGGKDFTEQQLLTELTNQYLTHAGIDVDAHSGMGTAVLRKAQESGQIDLVWEYTGTSLIIFNKITDHLDAKSTYETVKKLDAQKGLEWLAPSAVNNGYAFAMRESEASKDGIKSLSDLSAKLNGGKSLSLAVNPEFPARSDGLKPLSQAYGFEIPRDKLIKMDTGLVYAALNEGKVDIGLVFATDGRIPAFKLRVLDDDKQYFPSYQLAPVVRESSLKEYPQLPVLMAKLASALDNQKMSAMNAQVDVEKKPIDAVATEFLKAHGLI